MFKPWVIQPKKPRNPLSMYQKVHFDRKKREIGGIMPDGVVNLGISMKVLDALKKEWVELSEFQQSYYA